jgi:hypothetical protein
VCVNKHAITINGTACRVNIFNAFEIMSCSSDTGDCARAQSPLVGRDTRHRASDDALAVIWRRYVTIFVRASRSCLTLLHRTRTALLISASDRERYRRTVGERMRVRRRRNGNAHVTRWYDRRILGGITGR